MRFLRLSILFTAVAVLFTTATFAQYGMGGGMSGGMGGMNRGMMSRGVGGPMGAPTGGDANVDPVAMTGYFEIDVDKAIKKCKVSKEDTKTEMRKIIADFVIKSGDVYATYPAEFAAMEGMADILEAVQQGGGMTDEMRAEMRSISEGGMVIKKEMVELHKVLQADMEALLADNEKSLSRWKLYYKDICNSNRFSSAAGPRQRGGMRGEDGERDGMGGPPEGGHPGGEMGGPGEF